MMLTIRGLRSEDVPALIEIERASPTVAHWSESEYRKLLASDAMPQRRTLVAVQEAHAVGFAVAKVVAGEWEIENIVVRANSQRQGIGEQLLSRLIQEAKRNGARQILLEVRLQNTAARNLYAKCGFSVVGNRRAYYQDPEDDAVLYRLEL